MSFLQVFLFLFIYFINIFSNFYEGKKKFFCTSPKSMRKLWFFVEWTFCTKRSFFWKISKTTLQKIWGLWRAVSTVVRRGNDYIILSKKPESPIVNHPGIIQLSSGYHPTIIWVSIGYQHGINSVSEGIRGHHQGIRRNIIQ